MSDIIRISNIDSYSIEFRGNELILTPKDMSNIKKYLPGPRKEMIDTDELKSLNFTHSKILKCRVYDRRGNTISDKNKYMSILIDVWKSIASKQQLLKCSLFDLTYVKDRTRSSYIWCESIGLYYMPRNCQTIMKETLNMISVGQFSIEIKIKLNDGRIVECHAPDLDDVEQITTVPETNDRKKPIIVSETNNGKQTAKASETNDSKYTTLTPKNK